MKIKKLINGLVALLVSVSSLLVFAPIAAHAATASWSGGGIDNNMTTAANWTGNTAPVAGADLVFPSTATKKTVTNDFAAGTSFNTITFSGAAAQQTYTISGANMTLVGGVTSSFTGSGFATLSLPLVLNAAQTMNVGTDNTLEITGVISGTGNLTKTGTGNLTLGGSNTITGSLTVQAGVISNSATSNVSFNTFSGLIINSGTSFQFYPFDAGTATDVTLPVPMTLGGTGYGTSKPLSFSTIGQGNPSGYTLNVTGALTLTSNIVVDAASNITVKLKGPISGAGFRITPAQSIQKIINESAANTSATPAGLLGGVPQVTDPTVASGDKQPTLPVLVTTDHTLTIDGSRGDTNVQVGATLLGTGELGKLIVAGTVAPGHSPGCLSSGNLTFLNTATYEFEVAGTTPCTEYDQIKVIGTVDLGNGTLKTILFNNYQPKKGENYIIIDNDGTDAVTGTFAGLAEGATFDAGGFSFKVSYKGGDGNDVVISVLTGAASPNAPDTGFALIKANPLITLIASIVIAGTLLVLAHRLSKVSIRR